MYDLRAWWQGNSFCNQGYTILELGLLREDARIRQGSLGGPYLGIRVGCGYVEDSFMVETENYHDGHPKNGKQPGKWKTTGFSKTRTFPLTCKQVITSGRKLFGHGSKHSKWWYSSLSCEVVGSTKLPLKLSWCIQFQRWVSCQFLLECKSFCTGNSSWERPLPCRWASGQWGQVGSDWFRICAV